MNKKTTTLGITAALIGGVAALVSALVAGKSRPRPTPAPGDAATGQGASATPAASQPTAAKPEAQTDVQATNPAAAPTPITPRPAPTGAEGHAAPDLAADTDLSPSHRAPQAFRPDMDAPMTAAEREALRPATTAPSLVGESTSGPAAG